MKNTVRTTSLVWAASSAFLFAALPAAVFLCGCGANPRPEELTRNIPAENTAGEVDLPSITAGSLEESMVGNTVLLTGDVVEQCPASGCWMKLKANSGETFVDLLASPVRLSENRVGEAAEIIGEVVRRGSDLAIKARQVEFRPAPKDSLPSNSKEQWMSSLDRIYDELSKLETVSPVAFALAALAGLLLALTPTVLAFAPALMGYLAREPHISRGKAGVRSLAFVLGTATTFGAYGLAFGWAGSWLAPLFGRNGYVVAGIVLMLLGLAMLGKVRLKAPGIHAPEQRVSSVAGAYLLGLPFGLVGSACPCSIPVVLAMLLYAGSVGSPWFGAALLFVFALVRGLPLLFAGTFTAWLKEFQGMARWQPRLEKGAGVVLLLLGAAFIAQRFMI